MEDSDVRRGTTEVDMAFSEVTHPRLSNVQATHGSKNDGDSCGSYDGIIESQGILKTI